MAPLPSLFCFLLAGCETALVPERDPNQQAARAVEKIAGLADYV